MRRLFGFCVLTAVAVCAEDRKIKPKDDPNKIGHRDVGRGFNFYSLEREIALGNTLAQDVARQARMVDDPVITEFVNRLGQNLVRNSDAQVPFVFQVLDDDSVNAFVLPGGFAFVNTGLIRAAESEAELAGALAHEIAHVTARHGTRNDTRGQLINMSTIPLIFIGGWPGWGARQAAQFAVPLSLFRFSRRDEDEADNLGLQYMYKTGYDPASSLEIFERLEALEKRKPGAIHQLFSTHPPNKRRIEETQKRIQRNLEPRPEYVVNTSEFDAVKARLAMLQNTRTVDEESGGPQLRRTPRSQDPEEGERPKLERRHSESLRLAFR